jgi:hypothetical protein
LRKACRIASRARPCLSALSATIGSSTRRPSYLAKNGLRQANLPSDLVRRPQDAWIAVDHIRQICPLDEAAQEVIREDMPHWCPRTSWTVCGVRRSVR